MVRVQIQAIRLADRQHLEIGLLNANELEVARNRPLPLLKLCIYLFIFVFFYVHR